MFQSIPGIMNMNFPTVAVSPNSVVVVVVISILTETMAMTNGFLTPVGKME